MLPVVLDLDTPGGLVGKARPASLGRVVRQSLSERELHSGDCTSLLHLKPDSIGAAVVVHHQATSYLVASI